MLTQVYQSVVVPYTPWAGETVFKNSYLVTPPRIYLEEIQSLKGVLATAQTTAGAENTVKLLTIMKNIHSSLAPENLSTVWSFDGVNGEYIGREDYHFGRFLTMSGISVSIAGQVYAGYSDLHIKAVDPVTFLPLAIDYPPEHWEGGPASTSIFGFDEFSDLAVVKTGGGNTAISIHTLSTGALIKRVKCCGMLTEVAMESVGRCYVVHTNGVVSVVDYIKGEVVGVLRVPGFAENLDAEETWDWVYKRALGAIRTAAATDGASTIYVFGHSNLPVATNITPPTLLRAPRTGRYVPVVVRAYGNAGEPIPAQEITCTEDGPGVLLPFPKSTDEYGYAEFQYDCAAEGAGTFDAEAET